MRSFCFGERSGFKSRRLPHINKLAKDMPKKKLQIGVIGYAGQEEYPDSSIPYSRLKKEAYKVGKLLAQKGVIVITGGKGGIMEVAAKGVREGGGVTVGVMKGNERGVSNDFIDIEVITGMTTGGSEFIQPLMCDALIVIGGGAGTLQEITMAYRNKKPIVVLSGSKGWADKVRNYFLDERKIEKIVFADTPQEVVTLAINLARKNVNRFAL